MDVLEDAPGLLGGARYVRDRDAGDVTKFLNRVLGLSVRKQDLVGTAGGLGTGVGWVLTGGLGTDWRVGYRLEGWVLTGGLGTDWGVGTDSTWLGVGTDCSWCVERFCGRRRDSWFGRKNGCFELQGRQQNPEETICAWESVLSVSSLHPGDLQLISMIRHAQLTPMSVTFVRALL